MRGPSYDEADSYLASTLLYDSALVCSPGAFAPARRRDVAHESGLAFMIDFLIFCRDKLAPTESAERRLPRHISSPRTAGSRWRSTSSLR